MARKQCPTIPLLLLGIMLLITFVDSNCPNEQICDCTADYINCTCHKGESIIFEENEKDPFSGKEFIVSGCGEVLLRKLSLKNFDTESVYISDLKELEIESFAFFEGVITNLYISNIENLKLEAQVFSNIKNITNLTIKNVTLGKLESSIFSGTILHLTIKDSRIKTIEARSLHVDNCESITIENNTIRETAVSAIRISNTSIFNFIRNNVQFTQGDSFAFISVKSVNFGYCRFFEIATNMILANEIDLFSFHNNYIRTCKDMAFWGLKKINQVSFIDNQILVANPDSLIPNSKPDGQNITTLTNENNEIGCNCNIEWLLSLDTKKYNLIKEKNTCHDPPELNGLSLSLLQINRDKDGNCSSISIPTTTKVTVTTMPTTIETEVKFTEDQSTMASNEDEIAHYAHSPDKKPTNDQQVSCQDKHNSKDSSGNKYQCNIFLLFAFLIILIS